MAGSPGRFRAFEGEKLIGFVEGSIESWNDRFRISNICVFDPARRHGGLNDAHEPYHRSGGVHRRADDRAETQSCNESAIACFIGKTGFPSLASICMPTPTTTGTA